jgi:hypothetical protein
LLLYPKCSICVCFSHSWVSHVLQLTAYKKGGKFTKHTDAKAKGLPEGYKYCPTPYSNRVCSVIMYLNTCEGGGTHFNDLDITVEPVQGRALIFFPAFLPDAPPELMPEKYRGNKGSWTPMVDHEAFAAETPKFIAQQWVYPGPVFWEHKELWKAAVDRRLSNTVV